MLKLVKVQKNTIVYTQLPVLLYVLKWIDAKVLSIFSLASRLVESSNKFYVSKISNKIEAQRKLRTITKITAKYPKPKKGK